MTNGASAGTLGITTHHSVYLSFVQTALCNGGTLDITTHRSVFLSYVQTTLRNGGTLALI